MIIAKQMLIKKNACTKQLNLFTELFGDGGVVTLEKCLLAAKHEMAFPWAAEYFLSDSARKTYNEACKSARNAPHTFFPQRRDHSRMIASQLRWNAERRSSTSGPAR